MLTSIFHALNGTVDERRSSAIWVKVNNVHALLFCTVTVHECAESAFSIRRNLES